MIRCMKLYLGPRPARLKADFSPAAVGSSKLKPGMSGDGFAFFSSYLINHGRVQA